MTRRGVAPASGGGSEAQHIMPDEIDWQWVVPHDNGAIPWGTGVATGDLPERGVLPAIETAAGHIQRSLTTSTRRLAGGGLWHAMQSAQLFVDAGSRMSNWQPSGPGIVNDFFWFTMLTLERQVWRLWR